MHEKTPHLRPGNAPPALTDSAPALTRGRRTAARRPGGSKAFARAMYYAHLWIGVITTAFLIALCITGIALNHKRGLGLMPDPPAPPGAPLERALPLATLAQHAARAVGPAVAGAGIDRMDARPDDDVVKIRFDDPDVTEATVQMSTGRVLHVGARNDVFLEKLHSGEIFGGRWVLLSDAIAVMLLLLILSGYWMWLYPKLRR